MQEYFDPGLLDGLNLEPDSSKGGYRIVIPDRANIAADTIGRHARNENADRAAVVFEDDQGDVSRLSYADVDALSSRLAGWLARRGISRGDRVAVHSGPRPETAIVHMATYKLGAILVTLSQRYGIETMRFVLEDCGAKVLVTQDRVWDSLRGIRADLTALEDVIMVGETSPGEVPFEATVAEEAGDFVPADTSAEDPALVIYTSGSTGQPKGILHAHRILHAYNPSTILFYNLEILEPDLVFWTPADWAWVGGLNDTVFPAWMHGHTVVCSKHRFDAHWALEFMERHGITHAFIPPTALKRMARMGEADRCYGLKLRIIFTGGEPVPANTFNWIVEELGVSCDEGYGMTEVNHMIGNSQRLRPVKPGSMGWAFPGHLVAIVDEDGNELADGEVGEIVTSADNDTMFLGYWRRPDLASDLRLGPWVRTRDLGLRDSDGYFWYHGRGDDLIKSAGYRIGPVEVEAALISHPAVADAGVIGSPDEERGHVVKAYIRLAPGVTGDEHLKETLRGHAAEAIGGFKAPRVIRFVCELPATSSGKVSRAKLRQLDLEEH